MMMLTVDDYYDWYLKGKSLPEIMLENYYQRMQSRLHKCSSERGML